MANTSKRSLILTALRGYFSAVVKDAPVDDPYPFEFGRVSTGPLTLGDYSKQFAVGLVVGDEVKRDLFPFKECTLPIAIEFQRVKQKGEGEPGDIAEEMLTVVQRVVNEAADLPAKLGLDWVIDVRETGNHIDLDSFSDKAVAGVLFIEVQYRHARYDTRN
ncbi:hypothetical protein EVC30_155 [Rhizobium phage RHph_Y1_11]|nr:hypothetical protein EVC30_155 [Rhizobium phage RHph_Y1_11]